MRALAYFICPAFAYQAMPAVFTADLVALFLLVIGILNLFAKTAVQGYSQYSNVKSKH